jgi:hypothetical protein
MTPRPQRPSEWGTIGDHEQRIRILEADPGCCFNSGYDQAVAIRDRSCSWYGCGDGSTVDGSAVHNFQSGGIDGVFVASTDPETGAAGTVGEPVPWSLNQDLFSFIGYEKVDGSSLFAQNPAITTSDDEIDTGHDWSVNLWVQWDGWGQVRIAGADSYYATGYYGGGPIGGQRFYIATPDVVQTHGDPAPNASLECVLTDGSTTLTLSGGFVLNDNDWHMLTATYESGSISHLRFYVDGGEIDAGIWTGGSVVVTNPSIGYVHLNGGSLNGLIDEVGVWCDEALSAGDVSLLFFGGEAPPPTTVSDIDSGTADCGTMITADGSGNATWGNPCSGTAPFVMPGVGVVTVQDVVDALIAAGLVTQ